MKYLYQVSLLLILSACYNRPVEKTGLEGKPMPSFTIQLIDSTQFLNTSQLEDGKPIVLVYLSPYCPYCRAQMQDMVDDMDKMTQFQFCLVTSYPLKDMAKFYNEYNLAKYPNIIAGKDTANFVINYFKTPWIPYTAIYSKDKKFEKSYSGKIFAKQIWEAIEN